MKIDLKDGFCVSCGRESGVLYNTCPFCGESVWHPNWRCAIRFYVRLIMPFFLLTTLALNYSGFKTIWSLISGGAWQWQCAVVISTGLLLTPRHDKRLILTSSWNHLLWLLNSLAASLLLLLCVFVPLLVLAFNTRPTVWDWFLAATAFAGSFLVPMALNSGWWRVVLAALVAAGVLCCANG